MSKLYFNDPVEIDIKEFDKIYKKYTRKQYFSFYCEICKCKVIKQNNTLISKHNFTCGKHISEETRRKMSISQKNFVNNLGDKREEYYNKRLLKSEETCLRKYGSKESPTLFGSKKMNDILIEKYGSLEKVKEITSQKRIKTCLQKYGKKSFNTFGSDEFKKQMEIKYGVDNAFKSEEIKQKIKETQLKKYNGKLATQTEEVKQKILLSKIKKDPGFKKQIEKYKKTCLQRYGVEYISQTSLWNKKRSKKYIYKDKTFDSSWELAFFIFCEDKNIPCKRPENGIEYFVDNKKHVYFPDFILPWGIIEIKGDQFIDDNGNLINIYNKNDKTMIEKGKIMLKNNIYIISSNKIKYFIKYVKNKYGSDYLKRFKQ